MIITSEMIFIVFSAIFFLKPLLRKMIDPMPFKNGYSSCIIQAIYSRQILRYFMKKYKLKTLPPLKKN
jgi:hypothetical protein